MKILVAVMFLVMLLAAGVVEAGLWTADDKVPDETWCNRHQHFDHKTSRCLPPERIAQIGPNEFVNLSLFDRSLACNQRMRDVLAKMDRYLNTPVIENKTFETLPMKEFNQVVKDCVHGARP
jgi:hypothetical protein